MKYLIITEADWQNLRDEVLSLAERESDVRKVVKRSGSQE